MKIVLVIDKPNECCECPCFYDWLCCQAKDGLNVLSDEIPKECPLKPLPQKKNTDMYSGLYGFGWNDCLKEIIGE